MYDQERDVFDEKTFSSKICKRRENIVSLKHQLYVVEEVTPSHAYEEAQIVLVWSFSSFISN